MQYEFHVFGMRVKVGKPVPKHAVIKRCAHALTVLSVAWIGLSVMAGVAFHLGHVDGIPEWISFARVVWSIHIGLVIATIVVWIFERPTKTNFVGLPSDDEDDSG